MIVLLYISLVGVACFLSVVVGAKKRQQIIAFFRLISFIYYYPRLVKKNSNRDAVNTDAWYKHMPLIWAHAGGGFPLLYGNSLENYDCAIKNGFRCIEADIGLTVDGVPVMTHLFRPNHENLYSGTPTCKEFLNIRIADKYTPLTLSDFLARYKTFDGWIFLDGLEFSRRARIDYRRYFASIDASICKKIIVQVFKFEDLLALKHNNSFGGIHFSGIFGIGTNKYIRPFLIKVLKACGVKSVSISDFEIVSKDISVMIKDFRDAGMVVSVAGVNTLSYYKRLRQIGVNCIDSDYLTPADVRGLE